MPFAAISRSVITVSQAPERALIMPATFHPDARIFSPRFANCGVSTVTVALAMWRRESEQLPRSQSGSSGFCRLWPPVKNVVCAKFPTQEARV